MEERERVIANFAVREFSRGIHFGIGRSVETKFSDLLSATELFGGIHMIPLEAAFGPRGGKFSDQNLPN